LGSFRFSARASGWPEHPRAASKCRWEKMGRTGTFSEGLSPSSQGPATKCFGAGDTVADSRNLLLYWFFCRQIHPIPAPVEPLSRPVEWPSGVSSPIGASHVRAMQVCQVAADTPHRSPPRPDRLPILTRRASFGVALLGPRPDAATTRSISCPRVRED
jgi:hypothetical protein